MSAILNVFWKPILRQMSRSLVSSQSVKSQTRNVVYSSSLADRPAALICNIGNWSFNNTGLLTISESGKCGGKFQLKKKTIILSLNMSLNAILNLINREQVWASTIIGLPSIADYPSLLNVSSNI